MIPDNDDFETVDPAYREDDLANSGEDTANTDDLNFNEADGSFELDVKGDDPEYDHPDPYDTAPKNGDDFSSTYDEANPFDTKGEYDAERSIETDADSLGMHIDSGKIVELDPLDEKLAHTPEDDRDDLDEEGYPKSDTPEGFNR
jgi:hypothetical protein